MKYHSAVRSKQVLAKPERKKLGGMEDYWMEPSRSPIGFAVPDSSPPLILYIYEEIGPEVDYVEFVHALRYAEPGQPVTIHINSPGGNLNSCLSIINAMQSSEAEIVTVVDGEASSAAAMIWLAGHVKLIASRHTVVMLHGAGTGYGYAKTSSIITSAQNIDKLVEALLDDLSDGFLFEEEREDIRKGVDVYVTGTEIIERLGLAATQGTEEEIDES